MFLRKTVYQDDQHQNSAPEVEHIFEEVEALPHLDHNLSNKLYVKLYMLPTSVGVSPNPLIS